MRLRPATVIAILAAFIAIGGTATAASGLINGKKIKPRTITTKQFKNKSITRAKIAPSALAGLAGAKGPQGDKGERGAKGDPGAQGPQGEPGATALSASATKVAQAPNVDVTQVTLSNLPVDRYIATAKVNVLSQTAGSLVTCDLEANGGSQTDTAEWSNPVNNGRTGLWMVSTTAAGASEIKVVCNAGTSSATLRTTLSAVPTN